MFRFNLYEKAFFSIMILFLGGAALGAEPASSYSGKADILIFADQNMQKMNMTPSQMEFIDKTLHNSNPAGHLACEVKARIITEDKTFSTGTKRIEMLEVIFISRFRDIKEEKMFFPVGSTTLTRRQPNSKFAGVVEEIMLETNDLPNSRFIFQHDGNGQLVWMTYEDDLKTTPCRLKY